MERDALVEARLGKILEVRHGQRGVLGEKLQHNRALAGLEDRRERLATHRVGVGGAGRARRQVRGVVVSTGG